MKNADYQKPPLVTVAVTVDGKSVVERRAWGKTSASALRGLCEVLSRELGQALYESDRKGELLFRVRDALGALADSGSEIVPAIYDLRERCNALERKLTKMRNERRRQLKVSKKR